MNIPAYVLDAADKIIGIENGVEIVDQVEGSLMAVDPDNYYELLNLASTVARWIESQNR